jgi:hypothetical protein
MGGTVIVCFPCKERMENMGTVLNLGRSLFAALFFQNVIDHEYPKL